MKAVLYSFLALFLTTYLRAQESAYEQLMLLSNIMNHVKSNYVQEKKQNELLRGAVKGILEQLDPFTTYLDPVEYKYYSNLMDGQAYGLGIEFEIIDGWPTVISIVGDRSSEKKKIRTGDILLSIDGRTTEGLKLAELQLLLYDKKSSKAKLKFVRFKDNNEYEVEIKRSMMTSQTVSKSVFNGRIGYIRIDHFSHTTAKEFDLALKYIEKKNIQNLVLDLRDNPGGLVGEALSIADRFIAKGELLLELKGRKSEFDRRIMSTDVDKFKGSVAVLIGHGSASAAEILAGILQDHDRAILVGTNTFGKAYVQNSFTLSNGGVLIMTIGKYFLPSGRTIQRDFHGKSLRRFYDEILNTDSLVHLAPYDFKTKAGRPVQSGIGLIPDSLVFSGVQPVWFDRLEKDNSLFKTVSQFIATHEDELRRFKDAEDYQKRFVLDTTIVRDLYSIVSSDNTDALTAGENLVLLDIVLKIAIADTFFGNENALIVRLNHDGTFIRAARSFSLGPTIKSK